MYTKTLATLLPAPKDALASFTKADDQTDSRDTRDLMFYLMRIPQAVPRVRNFFRTRKVAVSSFDYDIVSPDKADTENTAVAKTACKKAIKAVIEDLINISAYGAIAIELEWIQDLNKTWTPKIVKSYEPIEIEPAKNADAIKIMPDGDKDKKFPINPKDRDKWILVSDGNFRAGGILRGLLLDAILMVDNKREWANYNTYLKGLLAAFVDENASDDERAALVDALQNVTTRKYAMFSKETNLENLDTVSAVGGDSFKSLISLTNEEFSISFLGQANTTVLPEHGGSRAGLEVLKLISADILYDDITTCEDIVNDQVLTPFYKLNYDPKALECPWKFKFAIAQENDIEKIMTVIEGCQAVGLPLMSEEVYKAIEFTKPENTPEILFQGADVPNSGLNSMPPADTNTSGGADGSLNV